MLGTTGRRPLKTPGRRSLRTTGRSSRGISGRIRGARLFIHRHARPSPPRKRSISVRRLRPGPRSWVPSRRAGPDA
ncbi:hypothetical protein DB35_09075 [Streptomyces abyssalis]|uniref:Uncharacterized protein n=1 Tax=Streptomyces abyssalis TaxID=933944 RepID=A0A1E7JRX7_9ACTN|nr:hypothetical protein AN215_03740 [Streptomyces abyssalis]OEU94212.1 hypothetical protein DB35_09075 [Streptomyces abyssalis]